jgi:hypothetical protein
MLWKARNECIFEGKRMEPQKIVAEAMALMHTVQQPCQVGNSKRVTRDTNIMLARGTDCILVDGS